jgi:hypothetical protein
MVMFAVGGAIAEELLTTVGYGADRLPRRDYEQAVLWATREDEVSAQDAWPTLTAAWAEAEECLKCRWAEVIAIAEALIARRCLTGLEILSVLEGVEPNPYGRSSDE